MNVDAIIGIFQQTAEKKDTIFYIRESMRAAIPILRKVKEAESEDQSWKDGIPVCPECGNVLSHWDGPGMRCYNPDCKYDHGNIAIEFKTLWRIKEGQ